MTDYANPADDTAWLDGFLGRINVSDLLCEALTRALDEGAERTAIDNAIGAIAAWMVLAEKEELAFWQNLLQLMSANDHAPPTAKSAARRALRERPSHNATSFLAK